MLDFTMSATLMSSAVDKSLLHRSAEESEAACEAPSEAALRPLTNVPEGSREGNPARHTSHGPNQAAREAYHPEETAAKACRPPAAGTTAAAASADHAVGRPLVARLRT